MAKTLIVDEAGEVVDTHCTAHLAKAIGSGSFKGNPKNISIALFKLEQNSVDLGFSINHAFGCDVIGSVFLTAAYAVYEITEGFSPKTHEFVAEKIAEMQIEAKHFQRVGDNCKGENYYHYRECNFD